MAALSDSDRVTIWKTAMHDLSMDRDSCSLVKAELRAAVDAADSWADSNAASYNSALPAVARNGLTSSQKARILMLVLRRRYEAA